MKALMERLNGADEAAVLEAVTAIRKRLSAGASWRRAAEMLRA
jgi:hypothetical protein